MKSNYDEETKKNIITATLHTSSNEL